MCATTRRAEDEDIYLDSVRNGVFSITDKAGGFAFHRCGYLAQILFQVVEHLFRLKQRMGIRVRVEFPLRGSKPKYSITFDFATVYQDFHQVFSSASLFSFLKRGRIGLRVLEEVYVFWESFLITKVAKNNEVIKNMKRSTLWLAYFVFENKQKKIFLVTYCSSLDFSASSVIFGIFTSW